MKPVVQRMRSALLLTLVVSAGVATAISACGAESAGIVPEDTCILELTLPEGATVSVDGRDYGTKRTLTFRRLERGKIYRSKLVVTFSDGPREERELLIQGGRRVNLALAKANPDAPELLLQTGHNSRITCSVFSPDGHHVLTGSWNGKAILWDATTGRILRTYHGHTEAISSLDFSPNGRTFVAGSLDATATVWNVSKGTLLTRLIGHGREYQRVIDNEDGTRTIRLGSHPNAINGVLFSPNGKHVLTCSHDRNAILWDAENGQRLRTFAGHTGGVTSIAFSFDGQRILSGSSDSTAILWDLGSGNSLHVLKGHSDGVRSVDFGTGGKVTVTKGQEGAVVSWDLQTGRQLQIIDAQSEVYGSGGVDGISKVVISPDRRQVLVCAGNTAFLWDPLTGERAHVFEGHSEDITDAVFSPDGRQVLTSQKRARNTHSMISWDSNTGEILQTFARDEWIRSICLSPDGNTALSRDWCSYTGNRLRLWDMETGKHSHELLEDLPRVNQAAINSDGSLLLGSDKRKEAVYAWKTTSAEKVHVNGVGGLGVALSPDGRYAWWSSSILEGSFLVTACPIVGLTCVERTSVGAAIDNKLVTSLGRSPTWAVFSPDGEQAMLEGSLWNVADDKRIHEFKGHAGDIQCAAFGPAGKTILTGSEDGTAILWDAASGRRLQMFSRHARPVTALAVCPNGHRVLTAEGDNEWFITISAGQVDVDDKPDTYDAVLWDANTGRTMRTLSGHNAAITSVAFDLTGRLALTGSEDHTAILWDTTTGVRLRTFAATDSICYVAFARNGGVYTISRNGSVSLWDLVTGEEIVRMICLTGKDWLVITPEGFFDGSPQGMQRITYRVAGGLNVVPVERFFQDFYRPGLLAAIMRGERPLPEIELGRQLPPKLRIVSPESGEVAARDVTVVAEATDQGGGISNFAIFQNGSRLLTEAKSQQDGKTLRRTFQVRLVEGDNELAVRAASKDGSWESEPATVRLRYEKPVPGAELYLVAIGINQYADETLNLRFARADAEAIVRLFESRGPALYGQGKVHTRLLVDAEATKDNIQEALAEVAERAQPQDTLVVSLSGHGTMLYQLYYFLPHDARCRPGRSVEDEVREFGIPSNALDDWISRVPALKRVSIFDTCQSGGAIAVSQTARSTWQFQKALETMSRSQGSFIIAATAAGDEAQEVLDLGHGVLTYTLLAGLGEVERTMPGFRKLEPPEDEKLLTVRDWFGFAQDRVPTLSKLFFEREQLVNFQSRGQNFPILPMSRE